MSLIRRSDYANPYPSLWNKLFDDEFFNSNFSPSGTTLPSVNIRETTDDFKIEVAAPGMKKEDFNIELDNNIMRISSERKEEHEETEKEGSYSRREFSYQSFQRSFTLPNSVDGEKVQASYNDGVLNISIPKREEAKQKPPRQIKVA